MDTVSLLRQARGNLLHVLWRPQHWQDPLRRAGAGQHPSIQFRDGVPDLLHWSDYKLVHRAHRYGSNWWEIECPHVVYRAGYYYLFRTQSYDNAITHVFRSEDPTDFGIDDQSAGERYVGRVACGAPEIYQVDGEELISSNHKPALGTQLSRLKWVPA